MKFKMKIEIVSLDKNVQVYWLFPVLYKYFVGTSDYKVFNSMKTKLYSLTTLIFYKLNLKI